MYSVVYEDLFSQWEQQEWIIDGSCPGKHLVLHGNNSLKWSAIVSLQLLIHTFMTTIISNQDSSWHDVAHAAVLHPYCVILFILPDKHLQAFSKSITCNFLLPTACGHWQFIVKLPYTLACHRLQASWSTRDRLVRWLAKIERERCQKLASYSWSLPTYFRLYPLINQ